MSTLDYFPTIQSIVRYEMPDDRPLDGQDVMSVLTGQAKKRKTDIRFRYAAGESSIIRNQYKSLLPARELYDLNQDRAEENNIASQKPELAETLERDIIAFFGDVQRSQAGGDYDDPAYKPYSAWKPLRTSTVLAQKILETTEQSAPESFRGLRGDEVIRVQKMPQPAATDEQYGGIVAAQRMRKYGE